MDGGIPLTEAAKRLGVSREALRKRVARGSVGAYKDAEGIWRVVVPEAEDATQGADARADNGMDTGVDATMPASMTGASVAELREELAFLRGRVLLLPALENEIGFLRGELDTRKREVEELHVLLQTAQRQLASGSVIAAKPDERRETTEIVHSAPSVALRGVQPRSKGFWHRVRMVFGTSA